jgi:hypothetical protein
MRGKTEEKVVTKNLLSPMARKSGGPVPGEPEIGAMGFTPTVISFGENTKVEKECGSK